MTITDILKESNYNIALFPDAEIQQLETEISFRSEEKKTPYIKCAIREKEIKLTPEEIVRQLYVKRLILHFKYSKTLIQLEVGINFGMEVKRADIVVYDTNRPDAPYICRTQKTKIKRR